MSAPDNRNPIGVVDPWSADHGQARIRTIPVKPFVFPQTNKPSVLGGVLGTAPFTPREILRKTAASEQVGTIDLPTNAWILIDIERPTILESTIPDNNADGPIIAYNYGEIPPVGSLRFQISERTGICFLSNPGKWFVNNISAIASIRCKLMDASNPEVAARFLRQPGVNVVTEGNAALTDATTNTLIRAASRFRRAITLQNVPSDASGTSTAIRFSIDQPTTYLVIAGVWTGKGHRLTTNGAVTLTGDALGRGDIFAVLESAGAASVEFTEYRDL